MNTESSPRNRRILIVDDNPAIHTDFAKILCASEAASHDLEIAEEELFGPGAKSPEPAGYELVSAFQGQEALERVSEAVRFGQRFALAFVDVRMPPGWDGIDTASHLWEVDPELNIVICTAYSDYTWDQMSARLGASDRLVILKKPFDVVEVMQLADSLTRKWSEREQVRNRLQQLKEELIRSQAQLEQEMEERQRAERALKEAEDRLRNLGRPPDIG